MRRSFGVIGGDRRQAELARLLRVDGHTVATYGLDRWKPGGEGSLTQALSMETVVLPLPLCKGNGVLNCEEETIPVKELFQKIEPEHQVLAGQVKPEQWAQAKECRVRLRDYFLLEELTVANAAATAEAAIQVAMEHLDKTLLGMDCLVLGFGRIGKLLCNRLHGMGAMVRAAARKREDLAWIRAYGWKALRTDALNGNMDSFGVVFNTVPSMILDERLLEQLPVDCLCVDLASVQGIDMAAAEKLGLPHIWARSLPGQMVPCAAAKAIRDVVYYMILEE